METQEESEPENRRRKRCNVSIRQMEIDDIAEVFHLGERLFTAREAPNLYRTWDEYEVLSLFQGDSEYCLIAEANDSMVGFLLGTTVTKNHCAWKYGYLVWLGIDPESQATGVASKLFNRFRDLMLTDGVRMMLVDTEADNLPALHFFRKMGFGNPQEHIYLSLNLDTKLKQIRERKGNGKSSSRTKLADEKVDR